MRYYVAADIHGFFTPFHNALEAAGYYEDNGEKKIVICGDLFDRGAEARQTQDYVLEKLRSDQIILIRGNHEDLFCDLVTKDRGMPYDHHVHNGTYQTALDLTGYDIGMAGVRHFDFAEAGRRTPYYTEIIPAMLDYYETEHYVFVHGWVPCRQEGRYRFSMYEDWRNCGPSQWASARWYSGIDAAHAGLTVDGKTVVCGHWHCSYGHSRYEQKCSEFGPDADFTPYYAPGIIALDACTAHSGKVNVIVLED